MELLDQLVEKHPALGRLGDLLPKREIKYIAQHTSTDCGPTCLTMVLAYYGKEVRIDEVRVATGCGRDGVSALALVEAGRLYGLRARGVKIELDDLEHVERASILHWGFDHFVVFEKVDGDTIHIIDPAVGPRALSFDEVSASFTGVALLFEKTEAFQRGKKERPLWRYLRRVLGGSTDWIRIGAMSLLLQLCSLALPLINGRLVDRVIPRNDEHLLMVLLVGLISLVLFEFLAMFARSNLLLNLRTRLDAQMTLGFLEHLLALPYAFFQRRPTGDLMMRLNSNAQIREILTSGVMSGAIDGALVLVYLALLIFMSPYIAVVSVVLVAVQAGVFLMLRKKQVALMAGSQQKQAESDSYLVEMLSGIETLKATGTETRAAQKWSNLYVDVMNISMKRGRMSAWSDGLLHVVSTLSPFIILIVGTMEVMKGTMTLGTMLSVTAFANGFIHPVSNLVGTFWQFQLVGVYLERIEDVLATPKEQSRTDLRLAPRLEGRIGLRDVSFQYSVKGAMVVKNVTLEVARGQVVAIVGRSGSGKSTLASLLAGLYVPTSGSIHYDDSDLAELDLSSVRRQIGVVIQRPYVFGTSVRANITMGDSSIDLDAIKAAAKAACIHQDISAMPLGYDTPLTAGGASLSGGQRQRIALARALLRKPPVMLLDEATSALDNLTEKEVHDQLDELGCTRIIIAHRLSTIRNADVILVMEDGKLVEQGSHAALLAQNGAYARLVAAQEPSAVAVPNAGVAGQYPAIPRAASRAHSKSQAGVASECPIQAIHGQLHLKSESARLLQKGDAST